MLSVPIPLVDIWYALEWIIRIGALAVVPLRRTPAAARAWLLLIFFLPLPGLLLFLAIGRPNFPAWRRERFRSLAPFFEGVAARQRQYSAALGHSDAIAKFAETLGHMPVTSGNRAELMDDYDALLDRLIADIDAAERSVHLLVYIFANDAVGQSVGAALGRAVARGLDVRVLFDPVGSRRWRRGTQAMLRSHGVRVCETLPVRLIRARTRRDMRNHRKLFVIDSQIGYAGSQNIVAKNFRPGIINHELVARVTGPVVASMAALVLADWSLEAHEQMEDSPEIPVAAGDAALQLLPSGADYRLSGFETLLVWQLHQARSHVVIVTPYFVPDADVLSAMAAAVARGVHVDLVVSQVVDQPIVRLSQSSFYEELLGAGVHIHRFRDRLLHAKNVRIDDQLAVVGSSNVDLRSFHLNQEVSLLLYDPASIEHLRAIQKGYLEGSDELTLQDWRQRSRAKRLAENLARLVDSLL